VFHGGNRKFYIAFKKTHKVDQNLLKGEKERNKVINLVSSFKCYAEGRTHPKI
jgi:hypothetical protein